MKKPLFEQKAPIKLMAHAGYQQAVSKLDQLKTQLAAHRIEHNTLTQRLIRVSETVRQYAARQAATLPPLTNQALDAVARKVIAAGMVQKDVLADLRVRAPKPRLEDEYDAKIVFARDDEQATIDLLEHAIELQERELQTEKKKAIQQMNATLRPERERLISQLANALIQLSQAMVEEKSLHRWLVGSDPDLVINAHPHLFPLNFLENADVLRWIRESIEAGMLSREQIESLDLVPVPQAVSA